VQARITDISASQVCLASAGGSAVQADHRVRRPRA
jgi:hypothetical protein